MPIESIILSALNLATLIGMLIIATLTYFLQKRLVKFQGELVKFQGELVKFQRDLVRMKTDEFYDNKIRMHMERLDKLEKDSKK